MSPKYPFYIISKGRWERCLTARALSRLGVDFKIVVEPSEYSNYASVIDKNKIIKLPKNPLTQYASKSNEEAFCEALGLHVTAKLPEVVRYVLKQVLPIKD